MNARTQPSLKNLILGMADIESVNRNVKHALSRGTEPEEIVDALYGALQEVGKKYEKGEFFLSELMMAGILATEVTRIIGPHLARNEREIIGKMVIGTVKGDIHDIGKNIVVMMLRAVGFQVLDLGIDVSVERFVEAVRNEKPNILGMSALLTSTVGEMKKVVEALTKEGLRHKVKVMIGGRAVSKEFTNEIGVDGYAKDSVAAIEVAKKLVEQAWY